MPIQKWSSVTSNKRFVCHVSRVRRGLCGRLSSCVFDKDACANTARPRVGFRVVVRADNVTDHRFVPLSFKTQDRVSTKPTRYTAHWDIVGVSERRIDVRKHTGSSDACASDVLRVETGRLSTTHVSFPKLIWRQIFFTENSHSVTTFRIHACVRLCVPRGRKKLLPTLNCHTYRTHSSWCRCYHTPRTRLAPASP